MCTYDLIDAAKKDFKRLDRSQKKIALAMMNKLIENPLPKSRGGYGNLLENDDETGNLTGLYKLKSRGSGLCIVYRLIEKDENSTILVIGMREDKEDYKTATKRIKR